ncbi:polyprotein [Phanerochaete sordida]|uniref:Polyprotein n=1 Tax=Phanerochaete sordida TaxID=48140 RepID=A0A9P3LLA8_9APHY|nr:polyprotein [Phanerochaete sordida]
MEAPASQGSSSASPGSNKAQPARSRGQQKSRTTDGIPDRDTVAKKLNNMDRGALRAKWFEEYKDITSGVPNVLPPLREINHAIPLIDETLRISYHHPRCAEALKPLLKEKTIRYVNAGWWEYRVVPQAAPMICMPKRDGADIRTVVDCRKRNDNTIKDVTPFPDQEQIRFDVARAAVRSKVDLSDAYEQIRVDPGDVHKTAFATVYGTMISHVMQQGDCNAPSTFQRLMTHLFHPYIGIFVHVYLDDIFIYSDTVEEHDEHLRIVFDTLRRNHLFLKATKCDLYSKDMDCLGHRIDDQGLHADADKMARIREWRTPRDYHDVQRFLGLVQYLAHFMPDISAYTGPLSAIVKNGRTFLWRPIHQRCFDTIKWMACRAPILKPIDLRREETVWLVCDASISGVGAYYGQGPEWDKCRPAGFMSKKFTSAQHSYKIYELELLAILEALLKWEDKLLGRHFHIITDHEALQFVKHQPTSRMSYRQLRWMEYLSRYKYDISHEAGVVNVVSDCFSRYYSNDRPDEVHPYDDYVHADVRLDQLGEDLPLNRFEEYKRMRIGPAAGDVPLPARKTITREELNSIRITRSKAAELARGEATPGPTQEPAPSPAEPEPMALVPTDAITPLPQRLAVEEQFFEAVRAGYAADPTFNKIIKNPAHFANYEVRGTDLITKNRAGDDVLCIPRAKLGKKTLTQIVIEHAHTVLGHFGYQKTDQYIRRWYWWPTLGKDTRRFCDSCGVCQVNKPSNQAPAGLLHSLPIPSRPWGSIAMDFVGPFPRSGEFDYLWVVICRLTSMVHLTPIKTTVKASELAWIFIREVVRLHGLPDDIVSDRDSKFTSKFWQEVHRVLGTRLLMSTAFHPQTDGATERANRSITQILRSFVHPDQSNWADQLPMVEFAINSSISKSTGFAPFELNYGQMPRMVQSLPPAGDRTVPGVRQFARQALDNLIRAHDSILDSRVSQTHHANQRRRSEDSAQGGDRPLQAGDLVYLSTENLALPKNRARKLVPRYIGPYEVLEGDSTTSAYLIRLPDDLKRRGIHPRFHASLLRRHEPNDSELFPHRDTQVFYDLGSPDDAEYLVDEIVGHEWRGKEILFQVKWNVGGDTLEPIEFVGDLEALDRYLELAGVGDWRKLPRRRSAPPAPRQVRRGKRKN